MISKVIEKRVLEKIASFSIANDTIFVLKGIPVEVVDKSMGKIDLSKVVENKLAYLFNIIGKRNFITYEEFLLMADFVVSQYKEVIILNNNLYMEQHQIENCFEESILKDLLVHYSVEESLAEDERELGNISEYVSIFQGIKQYGEILIGAYSDVPALQNPKVIVEDIFASQGLLELPLVKESTDFVEVFDESDYVLLLSKLFEEPESICIRIATYTGDSYRLREQLSIALSYWANTTGLTVVGKTDKEEDFQHKEEFTQILDKYWGYQSFRNLSVYDIPSLEKGEKVVKEVSQESIISNLVNQVEICGEKNEHRDLFVTAPTGAGKSVMFQIPAIYLAEKYDLLTIVISPLIGLMNDQVKNLEVKKYPFAKTINSDISPIIKQDIIKKVSDGEYHILYMSPETLLSRSDVEALIGNRTIGMIVVDEAHIVTTWGKQFRPDYWYLGEHIRKLRKKQEQQKGRSFVIATFTATAIYKGVENMYTETISSLNMANPITYLGYVKRDDIDIDIRKKAKDKSGRTEYELDKFVQIEELLHRARITNKKTLVYFPTVALINRCYEYLRNLNQISQVAIYYGSLDKDKKQENYEKFLHKEKLLMLATKAFGMGIDINDIEIVAHFAPTGNVCDYVQEIGRAARRSDLRGEALYHYDSKDFKHINRLHGMSTVKKYQLIKILEKIDELYQNNLKSKSRGAITKKSNAMLLDAENFSYVFSGVVGDEDNNINKVKTALLLIQKDYENTVGFSPITVRPIPLFAIGFFEVEPIIQKRLNDKYPGTVVEIDSKRHICRIMLDKIWNKDYEKISFPMFKYMIYSNEQNEINFNKLYPMKQALSVSVELSANYESKFASVWDAVKSFINKKVITSEHTNIADMVDVLVNRCKINKYKAQTICDVILASMNAYRIDFSPMNGRIADSKTMTSGETKYRFFPAVHAYFNWIERSFKTIISELEDSKLFIVNEGGKRIKEVNIVLGVLESIGVLSFEMIGGANSQLYIYVNQIQAIRNILNSPQNYRNRLLDKVADRHLLSVKMLTYLYEGNFTNDDRWNLIEDYFLGIVPDDVKKACLKENPRLDFERV